MHGLDASIEKSTEQKLKFHPCMSFRTYFQIFSEGPRNSR